MKLKIFSFNLNLWCPCSTLEQFIISVIYVLYLFYAFVQNIFQFSICQRLQISISFWSKISDFMSFFETFNLGINFCTLFYFYRCENYWVIPRGFIFNASCVKYFLSFGLKMFVLEVKCKWSKSSGVFFQNAWNATTFKIFSRENEMLPDSRIIFK